MPGRAPLLAVDAHFAGPLPFAEAVARNLADAAALASGGPERILAFEPAAAVFTLGRRAQTFDGRAALAPTLEACERRGIAVLDADRGGLGTLHAPGQLVAFFAIDLGRRGLGVDRFVTGVLRCTRDALLDLGIPVEVAQGEGAGLWAAGMKIGSAGFRVRGGRVTHGLSLNVNLPVGLSAGLALCGSTSTRFGSLGDLLPSRGAGPSVDLPPLDIPGLAATVCGAWSSHLATAPASRRIDKK